MRLSLDIIRARKGDCLMLHYGTEDNPCLAIIDGGPAKVYGPHLRPRIELIRKARRLTNDEPLPVDLLVISHPDDDHIRGILDLTKELIASAPRKPLVDVFSLWHNSFENIVDGSTEELTSGFTRRFGEASLTEGVPNDIMIDVDDDQLDEEVIVWNLKALASIAQGARLRNDAKRLEIPLNPEFEGKLIVANEGAEMIPMDLGLTLTVIGPMRRELEQLHKEHLAWLKRLREKGLTPEDALAAYVDRSVANLSSIVALVEARVDETQTKRILLTGDARGDKILEGLELAGITDDGGQSHVDILKIPHHGSNNNLDNDFFERVIAEHYVFSGDGSHGNPERESLQMLLNARGNEEYEIHLTYPVDEIDEARKNDWETQRSREIKRRERNPNGKVRSHWSPEHHSLATLLDGNPAFADKVRIVRDAEPHLIDLLDKVDLSIS